MEKKKASIHTPQIRKKWLAAGLILVLAAIIVAIYLVTTADRTGPLVSGKDFNLMVITLDTMRADRIGAYGYRAAQTPTLDRLATHGVMFENCYSPAPITLPAHCSIFTGKYPPGHKVRDNGTFFLEKNEITLAEKMKEQGLETYAVISSFVLLSKFGLSQGFDHYDDSLDANRLLNSFDSEIKADQVYSRFSKWFDAKKKNKENFKFFAWIHFYDPHTPYDPPELYKKKFGSRPEGLYDGEVAFMDVYLGKIIQDLETSGLLEQTLIVVVGDHGEAFGEHGEFGHSVFCYQESIKVPLLFYNPRLFPAGQRVIHRVNVIDIMPTILELYRREIPADIQGKSFAHFLKGTRLENERPLYFESMHGREELGWAPLTGIIDRQYKYISLPEPELYDLTADKDEKNNLFWKKNRLARQMDKKLMEMMNIYSTVSGTGGDSRRQLSEADKQHLQSLGYISAFSGKSDTAIDPKQGILLESRFKGIDLLIETGELDNAQSQLQDIVEKNSKTPMPQYFGMMNKIYKKKNDTQGVIRTWQEAIEAFPRNDNFRINLAFEYFHMNRLEEAEKQAVEIIKNNAAFTMAYILRSRLEEKRERLGDALVYLEKAVQLEPQNVSLKINYAKLLGQNDRFKEAWDECEVLMADEAVLADPEIKSRLGIVLTEIHKNEPAFRLLSEAVNSTGDKDKIGAETWNYLGILYFRKKDYSQALEAYRQSIRKDPGIAKTYNNLGTLYLTQFVQTQDSRYRDRAMEAFDKALERDPRLISALNGRGSTFKFSNRVREALKDWQTAISVKHDFIDAYFNIGITYLQLKEKKQALEYFNRCKEKFYHKLPPRDRQRLDRLIREAGG